MRRARTALSTAVATCVVTVLPNRAAATETTAVEGVAGDGGAGVERISVAPDGTQADDHSTGASITPDGRHIVFASSARNLTSGPPTAGDRVFVRDQRTARTRQLGNLTPLQPPVISGDGAYLAYPVQWVTNVRVRLYRVATGATAAVNCLAYSCNQPSMNADGRYTAHVVYFNSPSPGQRIEVQDSNTGAKELIATFSHTASSRPSISDDGRKVVYLSGTDTYVHDLTAGTAQLVPNVRGLAIDPTGRYLLYAPHNPDVPSLTLRDLHTGTDETDAVSSGGRDVVFHSTADDVVPDDTSNK
ncbi:TolB family protein [Streptomyces broussonetiae]|uniref:Protein tolB n=1 Tax=Streptomyces broussonetiae TaxID=2686304 RepID=A0ABV5EAS8_9ACTN